LARRGGVAVLARAQARRFARPDEHLHPEGLSVPRHDGADPAVAEDSQRLSAHRAADAGLPLSGPEGSHLPGDVAHGGNDESPCQLRRRVGRHAEMLVRRQDDAELRAGIDVDVRIDASLADELEPGYALEQLGADLGALADSQLLLSVLQAYGDR